MVSIKSLDEAGYNNIKLVGGKAASLGEMIRAGLPVPNGFVVTTKAFQQGMTKKIEQDIVKAFGNLGEPRVAVRSSAVAEDSAEASWAGQLESYLNVTEKGLIEAIKKCWQSVESMRARQYADTHKVKENNRAVAVVVQSMVDSDIAGVMFTANPISGDSNEIMIEAAYGLGEMVVQGLVTPESVVVDRATGKVISRSQHRQMKKIIYKHGENRETPINLKMQNAPILTAKQAGELADLSKKIEWYYTAPQDIEWAIASGVFYILQSRPITPPLTGRPESNSNNSRKFFLDTAKDIFRWGPIRGRYYYISDFVVAAIEHLPRSYKNERFPEGLLLFNEEQMVWLSDNEQFVENGKRVFKQYIESPPLLNTMKQNWEHASSGLVGFQITVIPTILKGLPNEEFIKLWQKFYQKMMEFWVPTLLPELGNYGAPSLLKQDLKEYISDEEELVRAQEILTAPEELSFYQQEEFKLTETTDIAAHHAKYFWLKNSYGHVEVLNKDFFKTRQSKLITLPKPLSQSELEQKVQTAKHGLQKQYQLPDKLIKRARLISENVVWQDKRKRVMSENFHYKKILLEDLARRTGKDFEELLDYGFNEVIKLLKDEKLQNIRSHHGVHFNAAIRRLKEHEAKGYWQEYAHPQARYTDSIRGIVASTGKKPVISARVRVLRSSHDILKPGEVLVTAMTSPGYVFAMRHAAAVITDIGGLTSHAAIVAREIGVPCIVGTKVATQALKTGDEVQIDALHGIIKITKEV